MTCSPSAEGRAPGSSGTLGVGNEDHVELHLQERVRHQHEPLAQGSAFSATGINMQTATELQPRHHSGTTTKRGRGAKNNKLEPKWLYTDNRIDIYI